MPKISIDCDERYPDYDINQQNKKCVYPITQKELDWIKKTLEEYEKVQMFLHKLYEGI